MRFALLPALLFLVLGLPFLNQTGMHVDAALELACFYNCSETDWAPEVFGKPVPLMVMTYIGSLKAILYQPLLAWLPTNIWTLRLPLLLLAAGSVVLFWILLYRIWGFWAALAGSLLLATDASFVLTSSIDFGPVVGLHLCLLAAWVLLQSFEGKGGNWRLGLAFFLLGLGLWHKALFVWMLGGMGVAGVAAFPRRIWRQVTARRAGLAMACFCLGALPFLVYNSLQALRTFRIQDVAGTASPIPHKLLILNRTLNGSVLLGFLTEEAYADTWQSPKSGAAKASARLLELTGRIESNGMPVLLGVAALLLPWLVFTKARAGAIFCAIYLLVVWVQMALVGKTGASVHHVILLWPVPHLLLVLTGRELARKWGRHAAIGCALLVGLVAGRNVLLLNEYYADLNTRGTTTIFTDAIEPLLQKLRQTPAREIYATDWGYTATLCLLSKGTLPVRFFHMDDPNQTRQIIRDPNALFVAHTRPAEMLTGYQDRIRNEARQIHYDARVLEVFHDRNGRPRFELWRFAPSEETPGGERSLSMADPRHSPYLAGVFDIEPDGWRWSARRFSAQFAAAGKPGAELVLEAHLPKVVMDQTGPLTLTPYIGDRPLAPRRLDRLGDYRLVWPVQLPPNLRVTVDFALDKAVPPNGAETRELGLILRSVSLHPR